MSAVYITAWLATAYGTAHLIVWWRDQCRTDDAINEHLDATTQLSRDEDTGEAS